MGALFFPISQPSIFHLFLYLHLQLLQFPGKRGERKQNVIEDSSLELSNLRAQSSCCAAESGSGTTHSQAPSLEGRAQGIYKTLSELKPPVCTPGRRVVLTLVLSCKGSEGRVLRFPYFRVEEVMVK